MGDDAKTAIPHLEADDLDAKAVDWQEVNAR